MMHGLWSGRLVSARGITGPSSQSCDDPGVPGEKRVVVRVFELRSATFQRDVELSQSRHVRCSDRVGDRLAGGSVARQHELHRAHRRDQRHDSQFEEASGFLHLRSLDVQAVRFQRPEHLFDNPAHAIPGDDLARLRQRRDRVRCQQAPVQRLHAPGRVNLADIDDPKRDRARLIAGSGAHRALQFDRAEANRHRRLAGLLAALRRHLDRLTPLLRQGGAGLGQQATRCHGAWMRRAAQQMHIGRPAREQIVDIALAIAHHGDHRRLRETIARDLSAVQPSAGLFIIRCPLLVVSDLTAGAVQHDAVEQPDHTAIPSVHRQDRVQEHTGTRVVGVPAEAPLGGRGLGGGGGAKLGAAPSPCPPPARGGGGLFSASSAPSSAPSSSHSCGSR